MLRGENATYDQDLKGCCLLSIVATTAVLAILCEMYARFVTAECKENAASPARSASASRSEECSVGGGLRVVQAVLALASLVVACCFYMVVRKEPTRAQAARARPSAAYGELVDEEDEAAGHAEGGGSGGGDGGGGGKRAAAGRNQSATAVPAAGVRDASRPARAVPTPSPPPVPAEAEAV